MSKENKQFDFETMSVVLYAMLESGITLGNKHYEMMAAIDPLGRTTSSFDHQFRKAKARAKQLQEQAKNGGFPTPKKAAATPKGSAKGSAKGSVKRRKAADKYEDDEEDTPSKKQVKHEAVAEDDEYEV